jgi:hypothetical protein
VLTPTGVWVMPVACILEASPFTQWAEGPRRDGGDQAGDLASERTSSTAPVAPGQGTNTSELASSPR